MKKKKQTVKRVKESENSGMENERMNTLVCVCVCFRRKKNEEKESDGNNKATGFFSDDN